MDKIQTIALLLTAASAICAAVAAFANWLQARKAAQGTEVAVYLALTEKYGTEEMREAISSLAQFWTDRKDAFGSVGEAYLNELANSPDNARRLRGHSRALSAFFENAAHLYEGGFISRRLLKSLISRPGLNVFYAVAVPSIQRGTLIQLRGTIYRF